MPDYKITAGKIIGEYKFQNVYHYITAEPSSIPAFLNALIELEVQIFLANVNLTTYSVKNLAAPEAAPMEVPVDQFCVRTQTGNPLPPYSTCRMDLQTDGYAGMKNYRYSLTEADVDIWQINSAYIDEMESAFTAFIADIPTDGIWATAGGFQILVAQVYPYSQPRQLHRKRKPVTPA